MSILSPLSALPGHCPTFSSGSLKSMPTHRRFFTKQSPPPPTHHYPHDPLGFCSGPSLSQTSDATATPIAAPQFGERSSHPPSTPKTSPYDLPNSHLPRSQTPLGLLSNECLFPTPEFSDTPTPQSPPCLRPASAPPPGPQRPCGCGPPTCLRASRSPSSR